MHTSILRIAAAQTNASPGDLCASLEHIAVHTRAAAAAGCSLLLFPEISDFGYDLESIARHGAKSWPVVRDLLRDMARDNGVALACGVCLPDAKGLANGLVVFDKDGTLRATYRKTHLLRTSGADETRIFVPGDELVCLDLNGVRFGLAICYDLRFPELFRALARSGCHVLLVASAWPTSRIEVWQTLTRARAIENQCYLLGANHCGKVGAFPCGGHSVFVTPTGQAVVADAVTPGLTVGEVDLPQLQTARAAIPAGSHLRPDLYMRIPGTGTPAL